VFVFFFLERFKEQSEDDFKKQFSRWNKCLTDAKVDSCEDLFKKVHEGIRNAPAYVKKVNVKKPTKYNDARKTMVVGAKGKEYLRSRRFTYAERKEALQMKIKIATEAHE